MLENELHDFYNALLSVDRLSAEKIIKEIYGREGSYASVEKIIVKALEVIGVEWESGDLALAQVFMSGVICEELVEEMLVPNNILRKNKPRMGIGVLYDNHGLGKKIVKSVIRSSGYQILDLGLGLNVDQMFNACKENDLDIVLISTLMLPSALKIVHIKEKIVKEGLKTKIIAGGAPFRFDKKLWERVGADADGKNATDIVSIIESLVIADEH